MRKHYQIALSLVLALALLLAAPSLTVKADPEVVGQDETTAVEAPASTGEGYEGTDAVDSESTDSPDISADGRQEAEADSQDATIESEEDAASPTEVDTPALEEEPALDEEATLEEDTTAVEEPIVAPSVAWSTHVQRDGTKTGTISDSTRVTTLGTTGRSLRLEAISLKLSGVEGGITYRAHVQKVGWQGWASDGRLSGTTGRSLRLEAIQIKLTGAVAEQFDIYYRAHIQRYGWLGWAKNGEVAGSSGASLRLEAIQVVLVPKDGDASAYQSSGVAYVCSGAVSSQAHLASVGWQGWRTGESTVGIAKSSTRLEAIRIKLDSTVSGGITYRAHVQRVGWQGWVSNGAIAGTTGKSLRLEAIQIKLTGELSRYYDIYYRAYVQGGGWLGWAKNGETAGSSGCSLRMGALQIRIVPKGTTVSSSKPACMSSALTLSQSPSRSRRIVNAALRTPSTPSGYCAAWVQIVYANAGQGTVRGDACDLWARMPSDPSRVRLTPGMAIAVRHSRTDRSTASYIYGHVGIYLGNGRVLHSYKGRMLNESIDLWIAKYDPYGEARWGFLN